MYGSNTHSHEATEYREASEKKRASKQGKREIIYQWKKARFTIKDNTLCTSSPYQKRSKIPITQLTPSVSVCSAETVEWTVCSWSGGVLAAMDTGGMLGETTLEEFDGATCRLVDFATVLLLRISPSSGFALDTELAPTVAELMCGVLEGNIFNCLHASSKLQNQSSISSDL